MLELIFKFIKEIWDKVPDIIKLISLISAIILACYKLRLFCSPQLDCKIKNIQILYEDEEPIPNYWHLWFRIDIRSKNNDYSIDDIKICLKDADNSKVNYFNSCYKTNQIQNQDKIKLLNVQNSNGILNIWGCYTFELCSEYVENAELSSERFYTNFSGLANIILTLPEVQIFYIKYTINNFGNDHLKKKKISVPLKSIFAKKYLEFLNNIYYRSSDLDEAKEKLDKYIIDL